MSKLTEAIAKDAVHRCPAAKALQELDAESAADFHEWMTGKSGLTDRDMHKGLQALGHRVGFQTLGRHRRQSGECGCSR